MDLGIVSLKAVQFSRVKHHMKGFPGVLEGIGHLEGVGEVDIVVLSAVDEEKALYRDG